MFIMCHNLRTEHFIKESEEHTYIFDDAYETIYRYRDKFKYKHIIAVPTFYILDKKEETKKDYIDDNNLIILSEYYLNNINLFLSLEQIKEFINLGWKIIGHSHKHATIITGIRTNLKVNSSFINEKYWHVIYNKLNNENIIKYLDFESAYSNIGFDYINKKLIKNSKEKYLNFIEEDTKLMKDWFNNKLNIDLKESVLPFNGFNNDYLNILNKYNINTIYGGKNANDKRVINRISDVEYLKGE